MARQESPGQHKSSCHAFEWVDPRIGKALAPGKAIWQRRGMILFPTLSDDHPDLAHSPLLRAAMLTLRYTQEHGSVVLTKAKAFKRVFVHWAVERFDWPGKSSEEMFRYNKVIDEYEFPPLELLHFLLIRLRLARHLLGPRLSLLETLMVVIPRMQKFEDDLRDQWQSRAHRDEWRRMLRLARDMARRDGHDLTSISGEIHLATRAYMDLGEGLRLHQLVASGIAHRAPPKAWARMLGALSWLGESPLPDHPIRIARLPDQRSRYLAERNYLVLKRLDHNWRARWELEASGTTPALDI